MTRLFHLFFRKLKTFGLTIVKCSNWPSITLAKIGLGNGPKSLRFRDGFQLEPLPPLRSTWGEIFEPAVADLYGIHTASPDLIVDVGANVGAFTCRAAHAHRHATVHAFEPSERQADQLEKNVALNSLSNVVLHRDVVTKEGRQVTYSRIGMGGSSGIFLHDGEDSITLRSTTLDDIDYTGFSFVFIKLDCEGAEGEIIEWICANLTKLPPRITIACEYHHWCPIPREQIIKNLQAHGFVAEGKILFDESYVFASLFGSRNLHLE